MKLKEAIKHIIESGGTIQMPYKSKIGQWFGEIKIYKSTLSSKYFVQYGSGGYYEGNDIDRAIRIFMEQAYTSKNKGYLQNRIMNGMADFESQFSEEDMMNPPPKLIKLFKDEGALVDAVFKTL